ncbi:50S ribosomal protein L31 [Dapis sp. BLCC M229]|uniref:50S ribosomal protein L31 n=1 Tax=Dapis sp. BLCC M229 TaxID=3400188 RepID=UPI003CF97DC4
MPKTGIHPEWYPEAKVYCNGEVVMTIGSTQPEIHVDVWSGNHPFFTGTQKIIDTEGRVERFMRKYSKQDDSGSKSTKPSAKSKSKSKKGKKK